MNCPSSATQSGSSLGLLIRQVRDSLLTRWEREMARSGYDLTISQYITIKKLADGLANVTELARIAELNPGAMTRLLDKLEARGLIERRADPADRRALHIQLTEAGHALWGEIDRSGQRVREAAFTGMDDATRQHLIALLEQMRDNLSLPPDRSES